jgi:hypothetical protein
MMIVHTLTITGADDSTDINRMVELSDKYHPFLEWGILVSPTRVGARYPGEVWKQKLMKACEEHETLRISTHLCGGYVDRFCNRDFSVFQEVPHSQFYQINLGQRPCDFEVFHECDSRKRLIIQTCAANRERFDLQGYHPEYSYLYDSSGGRGVAPKSWPAPPTDGIKQHIAVGYAGGLAPETIVKQLEDIEAVVGHRYIWVDTESKVRYNTPEGSVLDFDKVQGMIDAVYPYYNRIY